ncbi:N-acetylmuramoyl-L-alanine amidase [Marininema halotolerans]|uniref:N-acetylmuramoyl-L-alanine amidase n=1 Tax=Marininema halotolerans TaxID=1155944 RepID=A0A1I6SH97_9BACL|nr:N-acetylmuramoyl-L-alanine amidase [Marininema halotolerans]SFS76355.1 N-acetylmuramoyl-L-alanine amidase [Marininema halotolerans]
MISGVTKKGLIIFFSTLALLFILTLPIFPSSLARPATIKVMADNVHQKAIKDYSKGKLRNVTLKKEDGKSIIEVKNPASSSTYTSPTIQSDIPFTDVGIHWKDGRKKVLPNSEPQESAQFFIRTSKDQTQWTAWQPVEVDSSESPDHVQSNEVFGNLIYADHDKYLQYKVAFSGETKEAQFHDVSVTFLNSEDGKQVAAKEKTSFASLLYTKANAAINRPNIVSRSQWKADEELRYVKDSQTGEKREDWPRQYIPKMTHLAIHHTDTPNSDPDPAARVRSIYYYHAKTKGWGDIAYNAIIGSDGKIYEGRKGKDGEVLTTGVVGGHTYSFNHTTFGVAVMGDYQNKSLPSKMRSSLIDLLAYEADIHGIDPLGKTNVVRNYEYNDPNVPKVDTNVPNLQGHKDFPRTSTSCPGGKLHADLGNIRHDVKDALDEDTHVRIIDNNDRKYTFYVGTWPNSTSIKGYYKKNYQPNGKGTGKARFTWKFNPSETGVYKVSIRYTSASDRASNAPYTVTYADGKYTKSINQKKSGGKWIELGTFNFAKGKQGTVQLTDKANGYVIADAVRFEYLPSAIISDNAHSSSQSKGKWVFSSNVKNYYGTNYQYNGKGTGLATFTWNFNIAESGNYKVYARYQSYKDRGTNSPYRIDYEGGSKIKEVNQRINGGKWVYLGTYPYTGGKDYKVTLSDKANGFVIADAIRLIKK